MSIRSMVTGYLDKLVDARFRRDSQGRLLFMPWVVETRGRVLAEGSYDEISRNPHVAEAYLGLSA